MKPKIFCCFYLVLVSLATTKSLAQTPHGWRGAMRDGIYSETGLLKIWPDDGPKLLWEAMDAGKGYSSPVVAGERIYVTGMNEDETQEILSVYTLDGKKVYQTAYGSPWAFTYPDTRTTPTIDNGKAYMISGAGEIVCVDIADGHIVWKVDGGKAFERRTGNWGTSESPLVFDNKVIYTPAGNQTTMVALDAQTGEVIWKSKSLGDIGTYMSPTLISWKGKRQIIGSTSVHLIGVNPDNGNIEWAFGDWGVPPRPYPSERILGSTMQVNIAPNTPLFKEGRLFFSHGNDIGGFMLQLNDDLTEASLLWKTDDLDTFHGGYVLVGGTIYGSNWITNSQGNWVAVDWITGETGYNEPWEGGKSKGAIIAADEMLYCYDDRRGMVGLVKPNPQKFDVVSEFRITKGDGPHWAHPVIHQGVLYIRHGNALMAFQIK
ncbi:MAG: PQQ-like beta-propeller repeat protein [Bacteroidales bacterium]|nr:PQQ-like beta-propeller repeat protein [Bacteroidales bacterium]